MRLLKCAFVLMLTMSYLPQALAGSPAGMWTTIDDKTGQKRAVIELVETDGILNGTISRVHSQTGDLGICAKCPGNFKDKPIKGLQFLWGLKNHGDNVWDDGQILDARSGKIYRVKVTVKGDKLYVRGYMGVSLIGRTQVWIR